MFHRYVVEIAHATPDHDEPVLRKVEPYKLWYVNNGLYVVGFDHRTSDLRVFAVERIRSAILTNQRFTIPPEFDFEKLTETAFQIIWGEPQRVRIRFSADQAPYVAERTWHPSQKITWESGGSLVLEFAIGNLWEVKRWLIGWGATAQVLEPTRLLEEITTECRTIVRRPKLRPQKR